MCVCVLSLFSCVRFFETLWTAAHQTLSMGFAGQIYWSGLPFPIPGDLPYVEIEPESLMTLAWQAGRLPVRESIPRQVDKKSRGPQGERCLGFSRRR